MFRDPDWVTSSVSLHKINSLFYVMILMMWPSKKFKFQNIVVGYLQDYIEVQKSKWICSVEITSSSRTINFCYFAVVKSQSRLSAMSNCQSAISFLLFWKHVKPTYLQLLPDRKQHHNKECSVTVLSRDFYHVISSLTWHLSYLLQWAEIS